VKNAPTSVSEAVLPEPEPTTPVSFTADGNGLLNYGVRHARLYRRSFPGRLDLPGHAKGVDCVAFSPDGRWLAAVDAEKVLQVSDALTGQTLWETNDLAGPGSCVDYSPDGRWLATACYETGSISIREAQTGLRRLELGTNVLDCFGTVKFSPDGQYLAAAGGKGIGVKVWTIHSTNGGLEAKLFKSWERGNGAVFAPNSRSLAFTAFSTNDEAMTQCVWDFLGSAAPRPVLQHLWHQAGRQEVAFTPDSHQLLAQGDGGAIVKLDLSSGHRVSSFPLGTPDAGNQVVALRLSPDGSKLAACPIFANVEILNPNTGKHLYSLPAEDGTIWWLAWSPDSRRLAVSRGNGNITIWDLEKLEQTLAQLGLKR
jgi:WD40 repeat protein